MSRPICVLQEVEYYTDKDGSYACKPSRRNGSPSCELVSNSSNRRSGHWSYARAHNAESLFSMPQPGKQ